jgi:tripartite-type tricarboxylate transporter receptor subunit TctC
VQAAVSGEVGAALVTAPSILGHLKQGRLRALAIGAPQRSALLPDVPTMSEVKGGEDTFVPTYFGFAMPAGVPAPIVSRLSAEIKRAVHAADVAPRLVASGLEPHGSTPEEMARTVREDIPRFARIVRAIGIKPE